MNQKSAKIDARWEHSHYRTAEDEMPFGRAEPQSSDTDYQAIQDGSGHGDGSNGHMSQSIAGGSSDIFDRGIFQAGQQRHNNSSSASAALDDGRKRRQSTLYGVTGYIIVTEFCERLAYYGFAGELAQCALYSTALKMKIVGQFILLPVQCKNKR